jgi:hypothetical protein
MAGQSYWDPKSRDYYWYDFVRRQWVYCGKEIDEWGKEFHYRYDSVGRGWVDDSEKEIYKSGNEFQMGEESDSDSEEEDLDDDVGTSQNLAPYTQGAAANNGT